MEALGVRTLDQLDELVTAYGKFDEFVVDVETMGPHRLDPLRNDVFWLSLAGPGRADAIPCGHPIGERVVFSDDLHRVHPTTKRYQERRINPDTGREKWFDIEPPFTDPPPQLWRSEVFERLRPLFFSDQRIIGHNVRFDLRSIGKYFGQIPSPPYGDTLVAAKLINENHIAHRPYSLDTCVHRAFGYSYPKIGKAGPEKFPYSEAYSYSYLDAKWTWLLWKHLVSQLKTERVQKVFEFEMQVLPIVIEMEENGLYVHRPALDQLHDEIEHDLAKIQVSINKAAGEEINLNANRQIAELVYDVLGHECVVYTARGDRSTARRTLEKFDSDPVVKQLLEHAELRKLLNTFVRSIGEKIFEGRVHPSFDQVGTVSGRFSSQNPNIQQIPARSERGKQIRRIFQAPPGHLLVVSDLSQIELRMLAHFTQDPVLLEAYRAGIDLHSALAESIFGPDFTPKQRMLAKNTHFSVLYGAGPPTLVRQYEVPTLALAERLLEGFYDRYKEVAPWKSDVIYDARERWAPGKPPYVRTLLGRKRRLPELMWTDFSMRAAAERQAISVTISGSAADLFKVIMLQLQDRLALQEWPGRLLATVHDEVLVEVPEDHAEEAADLVTQAMENVVHPFDGGPMLSVPIVADTKIVQNWAEAK